MHELIGEALPDIDVYVWTVNDPWRARELAALGVSAIITDAPDVVRDAI
jgi:glycerophosphoryl diester phosphodiesterase